jgi:hypothetical protein
MVATSVTFPGPHPVPLWIEFPDIDPNVKPWPKRAGEYYEEWHEFIRSLNAQQRHDYQLAYPEPAQYRDLLLFSLVGLWKVPRAPDRHR